MQLKLGQPQALFTISGKEREIQTVRWKESCLIRKHGATHAFLQCAAVFLSSLSVASKTEPEERSGEVLKKQIKLNLFAKSRPVAVKRVSVSESEQNVFGLGPENLCF